MPIRINLKEIFPSESQEILVDKLNFNFNKLLELGVGDKGNKGDTGGQGPVGPIGGTGVSGQRGSSWFVGTGDPNTQTFNDLLNNDFFIDSNTSTIWNYSADTNTWTVIIDLEDTVNNYLVSAGATFIRGLGTSSPDDDRYIVFPKRGNTLSDISQDLLGGGSNNDILFLNNFNEKLGLINITNFPLSTNDLYNAIQKIYTDFTSGVFGRYHLELGSLYTDSGNAVLTDIKHNLKLRFFRDDVSGSPTYLSTNQYVNIARFSLTIPELGFFPDIDFNALYEFITPKYNAESGIYQNNFTTRIGAYEALGEYASHIVADGISFSLGSEHVNVGLASNYDDSTQSQLDNKTFLMLDANGDISILLNKETYQTGGNFKQVISTSPELVDQDTFYSSASAAGHHMSQSIISGSNYLWVSSGRGDNQSRTDLGYLVKYDITNPEAPESIRVSSGDKATAAPPPFGFDQHGHTSNADANLGLIKDIAEFGRYIITINHRATGAPLPNTSDLFVYETDAFLNTVIPISEVSLPELEDAYRIKIQGKYAWVITNQTYTSGPYLQSAGAATTDVQAKLTAIDLSNPLNPEVRDSYSELHDGATNKVGYGTKYLDFEINDNKALVVKLTNYVADSFTPPNSKHSLELLVFDIENPSAYSDLEIDDGFGVLPYTPQSALTLENRTVNTSSTGYAGIATYGRYAYIVWENRFFIVEIDNLVSLKSSLLLSSNSIANDIVVSGNYAYVLAEDTGTSGFSVQIYDISNKLSPVLVSKYDYSNIGKGSRLVQSGKYLYIVGSTNSNAALLYTLEIPGTELPSAHIGDLKTKNIDTDSAYVKNNLNVKNDAEVGGHLHAQDISANFTHIKGQLDTTIVPAPGTGWGLVITPSLLNGPAKLKMNTEVHDAYSEFSANGTSTASWPNTGGNLQRSRFTAKSSGYYSVRGLIQYSNPTLPFTTLLLSLEAIINGSIVTPAPPLPSHGGWFGGTGTRIILNAETILESPGGVTPFDTVGYVDGESTIWLNSGDYVELAVTYFGVAGGNNNLYVDFVEFTVDRLV